MIRTSTAPEPVHAPAGHIRIALDAGQHPATGRPLLPDATCGSCAHLTRRTDAGGNLHTRCALAVSHRGGPDVHPTYPGCDQHQSTAAD